MAAPAVNFAAKGDPAAGKEKTSMCAGCHGIPDYRTAFPEVYSVPKLGGQHAAYIMKALQEYKAGNRNHPSMPAIAAGLSDQDMADIAAYYAADAAKAAGNNRRANAPGKVKMKKTLWLVACLMLAGTTAAHAGDPTAGKFKSKTCAACHGIDGNSQSPDFPRLAGQHYDYLVKALNDYKSGGRKNPIMAPQAKNLSSRDIEDLAAYFSGQTGLYTKY